MQGPYRTLESERVGIRGIDDTRPHSWRYQPLVSGLCTLRAGVVDKAGLVISLHLPPCIFGGIFLGRSVVRSTLCQVSVRLLSLRGQVKGSGNGQQELVETITGLREPISGHIMMNGRPLDHADARRAYRR